MIAQIRPLARLLPLLHLTVVLASCQAQSVDKPEPASFEGDANPKLVAHTEEFERKVYTVTEGVYQAVGFGVANSIMVEGDECVFIVDVMGSMETAKEVKAEFDKITQKPVGALIYTHNHADHVMGGLGFVPDGKVDAYAHDTTNYYIDRVAEPSKNKRPLRATPHAT